MADYLFELDGVERQVRRGTLLLRRRQNVRPTLEAEIQSLDGSFIPAEGAAALLTEAGIGIFGGRVQHPSTGGLDGEAVEALGTRIDCVDHAALADDLYLTDTFPGGTVKEFLQFTITTKLGAKGVTLDPAQPDGPATIPVLAYTYRAQKRVSDGLTDACKFAIGWTWTISPTKVLSATAPGATPAPFNIVDGDPRVIGDIRRDVTSEQYANRIIVAGATTPIIRYKDDLTALTDGARVLFPLTLTPVGEYPHLPNAGIVYVIADAGYEVGETFGLGSATWIYHPDTNEIEDTGILYDPSTGIGTPGGVTAYRAFPLPLLRPMWLLYDGIPKAIAIADDLVAQADPNRGVVERVIPSELQDQAALDAQAAAELVKAVATPETVVYETDERGLLPGQVQTINQPLRHISGSFLIQAVDTRDIEAVDPDDDGPLLRHTVTAVQFSPTAPDAAAYPGTVGDLYTLWSSDRSGGAPGATAGPGLTVPGLPRQMIFNDGGVLGAAPDVLHDKNGTGERYGLDDAPARLAVASDGVAFTFTKLYAAFSAAASYSPPTFKGAWNDTASVITRRGLTAPISTGGGTASSVYVIENGSTPVDLLHLRIVSDALAAQTITGTIDLMLLCATQPWPDMKACWHVHVYVTVGDTDAVRCTLLNNYRENDPNVRYGPGTGQFSSFVNGFVQGNKLFAPAALTPGAVSAGDHLVIEIGAIARNTYAGSSPGVRIQYGENLADTDALDEDDGGPAGSGDHNNGYVLFSSPIALAGAVNLLQAAIVNRTAGRDYALTIAQTNTGENWIKAKGGINISTDAALALLAAGGASVTAATVALTATSGAVSITAPSGLTVNGAPAVTAPAALTLNQLVIGAGGNQAAALGASGTATTVLHGNASGPPTFGPVSLTADVSGRLPYANLTASTAAARLLGRGDGGAGDWQELTLGTGLGITGTTLSVTGGAGGATHYDAPLTDGDLVEANLIFALGECIIVQVPV